MILFYLKIRNEKGFASEEMILFSLKIKMRRALIFSDCKTNFGEGSFRVFIFSVLV